MTTDEKLTYETRMADLERQVADLQGRLDEGFKKYAQPRRQKPAARIDGKNRDLRRRPLGQQPHQTTLGQCLVAVGGRE
jgi:hypothetical protein